MNHELDNFRLLVFLSGTSLALAIAISYAPMPLAPGQEEVLSKSGAGALAAPGTFILLQWAWLALYSLAHALAFGFVWWAKPVFVVAFVVAVFSNALTGLLVSDPWANTLWALHNTASTFAIGMLFFSPGVRRRMQEDVFGLPSRPPHCPPPSTPVGFPQDAP
jgi:hypothetical protein